MKNEKQFNYTIAIQFQVQFSFTTVDTDESTNEIVRNTSYRFSALTMLPRKKSFPGSEYITARTAILFIVPQVPAWH